MRLQVAVGAGDVSDFYGEEDVAVVVGPMRADFYGLVVGDAAGLGTAAALLPAVAGDSARATSNQHVDFNVFVFFLALVDGIADEREFAAVGRGDQVIHAQRRGGDGARAGSEVGFLLGLSFFLLQLWRARRRGGPAAACRSRAKMVSPRSAVRYCTTSFHCFL